MAATVVARWAPGASPFEQLLGDIPIGGDGKTQMMLTRRGSKRSASRAIRGSMWESGVRVFTGSHAWPRSAAHIAATKACADVLKPHLRTEWWDGVLRMEGRSLQGAETLALMTPTTTDGLVFCSECLPYCSTVRDRRLLDRTGRPFQLAGTALACGTQQLRDVLTWHRAGPGQV